MKTVFIIFTLLAALVNEPETQEFIIEAAYVGIEEGVYTFIDDDELEYEFSDIDVKASKKYNLDSEKFVGKKFEITYWMDTEIDENDEEYDIYIIVNLDLVN
ncbi:hypothetical protein [Flagellimonas sp. S3867]|uniref:hypothetical protein n=1 Tax=Flagellimonas sp. S3867 TaxID=2768063 RepID=UPI001689AF49|nr:hypothetical protein [Flagellimonas sp. S3867]